jgi:oligopeptidase B
MKSNISLPPACKQLAKEHTIHGDVRNDPYYWLRDREDKEVIDHLHAENDYTNAVLEPTEALQETLYEEIVGRMKKDDSSVPYRLNGYWYYTRYEEGKEYPIHCRRENSMEAAERVLIDVNPIAEGEAYCSVAGLSVSPDNRLLAYGTDFVSRRMYNLKVLNLESGEHLDIDIPNTTAYAAWSADSQHIFYTLKDEETLRASTIMRLNIRTGEKQQLFHEEDETFYAFVTKTKSRKYLVIHSSSTLTTEVRFLDASDPTGEFKVFEPRERGHEYSVEHRGDEWFILTNWNAENFRLMKCGLVRTERSAWEEVIPHRKEVLLEDIELFSDRMVLEERMNGQVELRVIEPEADYHIPFEEDGYMAWIGQNPEMDSDFVRIGYTSMTTPASVFDYSFSTKKMLLRKQQTVVGGYDKDQYQSERLFLEARDGTRVPVNLVYKKGYMEKEEKPLLLYGYGSYGNSLDPYFSSVRLSLLDRGFAFAIAHVRGGEEMGRKWYEDGRQLKKWNTFNDFIDVGRSLLESGYASAGHLYAMGGSAGGLLMGVVINEAPELWNGVIAAVPFVDVVTTMLDDSIPLTTGEYDEWGNPNDPEFYHYIKSYSPYDQVKAQNYPSMLVTTGLHDSQVQYWEPAKWVARLREMKTDDNVLLLHTEMEAGHGGKSGRFERHRETAMEYAFLLWLEGIGE